MGILERIEGNSVYLDANIFIYAVESYPQYQVEVAELFSVIDGRELSAFTSELTLAEVLVKPISIGDSTLIDTYKAMVSSSNSLTVLPVTRQVLVRAAKVRSDLGLRLPDAIHFASALEKGCVSFLTNDREMKTDEHIHLVLI